MYVFSHLLCEWGFFCSSENTVINFVPPSPIFFFFWEIVVVAHFTFAFDAFCAAPCEWSRTQAGGIQVEEGERERDWKYLYLFVSWVRDCLYPACRPHTSPSPDCLHLHTQLPHQPNPGVSTGQRAAGRSGRQWQAEPDPIGCLHLQSGGFPDHLEKRLQHRRPQGLNSAARQKAMKIQKNKKNMWETTSCAALWVICSEF